MYVKNVDWTVFKSFVDSKKIFVQCLENNQIYELIAIDGSFVLNCTLDRLNANADTTEFESTYKANCNKSIVARDASGRQISTSSAFSDTSGFRFRGSSFKENCLTGVTTPIDYLIEQERYINGGFLIVDNIGLDDKISFQVVDKDNILGFGTEVVLDEFITDYYIPNDGKLEVKLDYPAKIMAGLYVRLLYSSTHASGCLVKCNLYLHWKTA